MERVRLALRRVQRDLSSEQVVEIDGVELELERSLLDPLQVEQVVQQLGEPACLGANHLQIAPHLFGGHVPIDHERREAQDARERRAQLVGDVADQLRLRPLALDERPVPLLQIGERPLQRRRHRVERSLELSHLARPVLAQTAGQIAAGDLRRGICGRADRSRDRPIHVDRTKKNQEESGTETDAADDERVLLGGVGPFVAFVAEARLGGEEAVETVADRVHQLGAAPALDHPASGHRVPAHEVDKRPREGVEIGVDRLLDSKRAPVLQAIVPRQCQQVRERGRITPLCRAPGREVTLVVRDHEAAQAGLQIDDERLEPVRRRDHLLRMTRLQ